MTADFFKVFFGNFSPSTVHHPVSFSRPLKFYQNFYPWYQATIVVSPRIVKSSLNKPMPQVHSRWEDDDLNLENEIGLELKSRPLACSDL